ncbi:MAG: extracellular solute-binding protein [Clostridia bacterium]|nr:extracellular solute-binding protein [Clostridia bacterium]
MKKLLSLLLALLLCLSAMSVVSAEDGPHTITFMLSGDNTVTDENLVLSEIRQRTGINLVVNYISSGDYQTKINTLIAANTLPDIFSISGQTALDLRDAGKLTDMRPYLEEYGPHILASYEEGELEELLINEGDAVYGLNDRSGLVINTFLIRKDWLEKVGLDNPTSVDELYEVMRAFTFDDPDGNGEDDTYGYVAAIKAPNTWEHVFSAFGIPFNVLNLLEDGTVTTYMKNPRYLECIEFLRTLYSEGILDPDFATMTQMESFERFWNGKVGMFNWNSVGSMRNWYPGRYVFEVPEQPGDLFARIEIVDDETGEICGGKKPYADLSSYCAVIAKSCEHPEDAIRLLDYLYYTPEGGDLVFLGVEDVMYRWIDKENGLYERIGEYADDVTHRAAGGYVYSAGRGGWTVDNSSVRTYNAFARESQQEEMAVARDWPYIPVILDAYTEYGTQLNAIEMEALANLIVTTGDVEAEYAEYIARWENEGGLQYEAEATQWWADNR